MDVERALINAMLVSGDLSAVHERGIRPNVFYDAKNRDVLRMMVRLASEYSHPPTVEMMRAEFPTYKFEAPGAESVDWLVDKVRQNHALEVLETAMADALTDLKDDNDKAAADVLRRALAQIDTDLPTTKDVNLRGSGEERLARYKAINEHDVLGLLSGFTLIDDALGGFKPGQLVTWVGPPKAGKSTALLAAARQAQLARSKVFFLGFEMSNEEQTQRLDAMSAAISHKRLTRGSLKEKESVDLRRIVRAMDMMDDFVFSNDIVGSTLSGIASKIERYKPQVLFVDGVYMMEDENGEPKGSPQALTNITRGFKRMAQHFDIPVNISTQVLTWKMDKKRGITDNSIGYSSSFAQDSDAIIGVEKVDDDPVLRRLKIVLARNAPIGVETFIRWDWDEGNFEELAGNPYDEGEGAGAAF